MIGRSRRDRPWPPNPRHSGQTAENVIRELVFYSAVAADTRDTLNCLLIFAQSAVAAVLGVMIRERKMKSCLAGPLTGRSHRWAVATNRPWPLRKKKIGRGRCVQENRPWPQKLAVATHLHLPVHSAADQPEFLSQLQVPQNQFPFRSCVCLYLVPWPALCPPTVVVPSALRCMTGC